MRQKQALAVMLSGSSVFLTGAPGAGKTYVLNEFIGRAIRRRKRVAVTASTGIAATHIGGTTIHAWSGLGIRDQLSDWDLSRLKSNSRLVKRYNSIDILVIDEISMLHGSRLDMVNQLAKMFRENDEPFGGMQVVLVGDLFQLPPIVRGGGGQDFAYQSQAWQELSPKICYLTEQHRQTQAGDSLLDLLEAMRRGDVNEMHEEMLKERIGREPEDDAVITRLYSHNIDVDSINQRHLQALTGARHTYRMLTSGSAAKAEQLTKSILAPVELSLAVGAEVMFVANDFAKGFANGTRGRIVAFSGERPVVELKNGKEIMVEPHEWSLTEDDKVRATASQLPLRLAWAITIHKSQGMSLDGAIMDLSRSFTPGMGYVALSRVRSMEGVYLEGINNIALQLHPSIYEIDSELRQLSLALANITTDAKPEEDEPQLAKPIVDEELLALLKAWRRMRAEKDSVPAFIVAHDTVLTNLATNPPESLAALQAAKGFGPKKVETYGIEILEVLSKFKAANV
jgi:ATP-dependent exoDNAse (exonuclease V) alpha subunit